MTWFADILFSHVGNSVSNVNTFCIKAFIVLLSDYSQTESALKDKEDQDNARNTTLSNAMHFLPFFHYQTKPFQRLQHYLAAPYFLTICATAAARSSASARVLASAYTRTASSVPEARAKLLPSLYLATTFSISFCAPAGVAS